MSCTALDKRILSLCHQLCDIFGSLLERQLIKQDFDPNFPKLIVLMDEELNGVKKLYDKQMVLRKATGRVELHKNMPLVSGTMKWASELRDRLTMQMSNFKHYDHPYVSADHISSTQTLDLN